MSSFAVRLISWQRRHGRSGLPWQATRDPYRVWLSEVMLQQTQVAAVIPYYERFLRAFPTVRALADADEDEVLRLWSGLGYYARGRNLHRASRRIVFDLKGEFPKSADGLRELPGVGRSTAAAIAVFAFGKRAAILDGNVKRVLARAFGIEGWPGEPRVEAELWRLAERLLPKRDVGTYTQALMDLGAGVCARSKPQCARCPVKADCVARLHDRATELPAPRPRRALPSRRATWLVLVRAGEVLLEKRPSTGVWGGMWAFPEPAGRDLAGYCRRRLGCELATTKKLAPLEHGFTHFRLHVRPLLCEVRKTSALAESPGRLWMALGEARGAAVPAPVKRLLERLAA
jgi:A/G-specific adenine glycosylase